MIIRIHGVLVLTTVMIHSNHGSISYVYSFRGKRRHRSKKECFPTPGVVLPVPLLSEIWGCPVPPPALWRRRLLGEYLSAASSTFKASFWHYGADVVIVEEVSEDSHQ